MTTNQEPTRRNDVIRCEQCGEDYSVTYKCCPFCDERPGRPRAGTAGRRVAGGANPLQVIGLVISLALIIAALFIVFTTLSPLLNKDNPVADLTLENIAKIYTGEITNWKDIGGNDAEIVLIGREANSGTRDGFESVVGVEDKCKYRQECTSTGDVITAVSSNPNAIGYASLASVKDSVKAVSVDGVAPSESTVKDGSYAVQRPFVLVTKEGMELSKTAQEFFDFATSPAANEIITAAGVVPVN